jgi:thioredoxin-related protein
MKKILSILLLLAVSLFADDWLNYDESLAKAKKENKILIVMLTQSGCPACRYMKNVVLKSDSVSKEIKKNFIVVELDIHEDKIPKKFEYYGTPTFYFTDKNGEKLDSMYGSSKEKSFLGKLKDLDFR